MSVNMKNRIFFIVHSYSSSCSRSKVSLFSLFWSVFTFHCFHFSQVFRQFQLSFHCFQTNFSVFSVIGSIRKGTPSKTARAEFCGYPHAPPPCLVCQRQEASAIWRCDFWMSTAWTDRSKGCESKDSGASILHGSRGAECDAAVHAQQCTQHSKFSATQ